MTDHKTAPPTTIDDPSGPKPRHNASGAAYRGHHRGSAPRRKKSPGVEWKEPLTKRSWENGRVLLIDYVAREHTQDGRRKIVAQEFHDLDGLRRYYGNVCIGRLVCFGRAVADASGSNVCPGRRLFESCAFIVLSSGGTCGP